MTKKIINLLLICVLLFPNAVFAEGNTNIEETENNKAVVEAEADTNENVDENTDSETSDVQESEEPTILPSLIKNATVSATDVTSCEFKWDDLGGQEVTLHFTYKEFDKIVKTKKSSYKLTDITFGETVKAELITDNEHETVQLSCNPSEEYKPIEAKNIPTKDFSKNNSSLSYYCRGTEIYTKNGTKIETSYYTFEGASVIKASGAYKVKAVFSGKYKNYAPLSFTVKVIPSVPTVGYNPNAGSETSFIFTARNSNEVCDNIVAEISTSSDYSNPIVKKVKPKNTNDFSEFKVTGLKKGTLYYIRIKCLKVSNGVELYSTPSNIKLRTTDTMPTYSWSQKDVKNIVALMKKNKTFTYTFNGHYDARKMYDFLDKIADDYPQYAGRYYRDTAFYDTKTQVKYYPNPNKMSKYTKATKSIDSIVKKAKKKKGVKNKVKYINKRMCATCKYDYDTYRKTKKYNADAYNLYGCLGRHKAVCMGYAEAFHAICVQCEIQDQYVRSPNHIWNKVKVGNQWLHCDITWNDCQKRNKTKYLLKKSHR